MHWPAHAAASARGPTGSLRGCVLCLGLCGFRHIRDLGCCCKAVGSQHTLDSVVGAWVLVSIKNHVFEGAWCVLRLLHWHYRPQGRCWATICITSTSCWWASTVAVAQQAASKVQWKGVTRVLHVLI
jgi:hypothetical protein